jgi:DNA-binding PadR family transcriptional regulator
MHRRRGHTWRGFFSFADHGGHSGGPWGFRRRFFESGEVRIALLSLLRDGPKNGYELMKELEARSGGMYRASAGTVYPNLQMLEDEGLIRAEMKDGKRVFAMTDAGRLELEKNKDAEDRVWGRASQWDDWSDMMSPGAFEVMGPAMRLARAAFSKAAKGDDRLVERIREILTNAAVEVEKA